MSWWVARAERTLSEEVPAPPDDVRDFYVDLDNIKLVHPLIVSVQATSRSETPEGYLQSYRVVDRTPLGPLTMRITYRARLHVRTDGDVLTEGVIDLAYEDSEVWTVVDFKTDEEIEQHLPRYVRQTALYAKAVEQATGKPTAAILMRV